MDCTKAFHVLQYGKVTYIEVINGVYTTLASSGAVTPQRGMGHGVLWYSLNLGGYQEKKVSIFLRVAP